MEKQGFDPDTKTLVKIIQFCERMEEAEDFGVGRDAQKTKATHNKVKLAVQKFQCCWILFCFLVNLSVIDKSKILLPITTSASSCS
jgi:hypothetical protein